MTRLLACQVFDVALRRRVAPGKRPAFTLLELMIVLAILTAVMLVAWPRIAGRLQLVGPREAALQLKSDLAEARERAIRTGEPWVVRIERKFGRYEFGPVRAFRDRDALSLSPTAAGALLATPRATPAPDASGVRPPVIADTSGSQVQGAQLASDAPASTINQRQLPIGMVFEDGFANQPYDANLPRDQIPPTVAAQAPRPADVRVLDPGQQPEQLPQGQPPIEQQPLPIEEPPLNARQPNLNENWKFAVIFQPDGRATDSEIRLKEEVTENKIVVRVRGFTGATTMGDLERRVPQPIDQLDPTRQDDPLQDPQPQVFPSFNRQPQAHAVPRAHAVSCARTRLPVKRKPPMDTSNVLRLCSGITLGFHPSSGHWSRHISTPSTSPSLREGREERAGRVNAVES